MITPLIPISIGELIDKITILQIKSEHTGSMFVHQELQDLIKISQDLGVYKDEYLKDLLRVNHKLWNIEDKLREHEKRWDFDDEFIRLARSVYITNDERSRIKKRINEETLSEYSEVKLY